MWPEKQHGELPILTACSQVAVFFGVHLPTAKVLEAFSWEEVMDCMVGTVHSLEELHFSLRGRRVLDNSSRRLDTDTADVELAAIASA